MKGNLIDLGVCQYDKAWGLQKKLLSLRIQGGVADTVLLVEHPDTITLGRRGSREHLKAAPETLAVMNIPVFHVERGGDVTYHGPGQAVLYAVLNLRECGLSLVGYVETLEELVIGVLGDFGIKGRRSGRNRGVWVGEDKIASIGIAVSKWVSYHGVALNYATNLDNFGLMDACGLEGVGMTSMSRVLGTEVCRADLYARVILHLSRLFERDWREMSLPELEALLDG